MAVVSSDGYSAPSSSGLGHHPLKVAARVRIPLGLLEIPTQPVTVAAFEMDSSEQSCCRDREEIAAEDVDTFPVDSVPVSLHSDTP